MEYITVKLFRVSQESIYLDIIAECLEGFIFNKIELGVRTYDHYGNYVTENNYSLTDLILNQYPNKHTSNIAARIPLSELFGEGNVQPAMYTLTLGCNTDQGITSIQLQDPYYKVKVGDRITENYVLVQTDDLVIYNSKELSNIGSDEAVKVEGQLTIHTDDGQILSKFPNTIDQEFYLTGGDYNGTVTSNLGISYISLPENSLTKSLYFDNETVFFYHSGGVEIGSYYPDTHSQDIILDSSLEKYLSIVPESGRFQPGDILSFTIKPEGVKPSDKCGIAILRKGQSINEIYTSNDVGSLQYVLTNNDIQESGELKLVMEGYSNTKISYIDIKRKETPQFPNLVISGGFNIPQLGVSNIEYHETTVYTSDTNNTFQYLMDGILNSQNPCTEVSDDIIRNYLILYGHLQALQNGQQSIAEEYFKILAKNFTKCGTNNRMCGNSCGCQSVTYSHPIHNSCSCNV